MDLNIFMNKIINEKEEEKEDFNNKINLKEKADFLIDLMNLNIQSSEISGYFADNDNIKEIATKNGDSNSLDTEEFKLFIKELIEAKRIGEELPRNSIDIKPLNETECKNIIKFVDFYSRNYKFFGTTTNSLSSVTRLFKDLETDAAKSFQEIYNNALQAKIINDTGTLNKNNDKVKALNNFKKNLDKMKLNLKKIKIGNNNSFDDNANKFFEDVKKMKLPVKEAKKIEKEAKEAVGNGLFNSKNDEPNKPVSNSSSNSKITDTAEEKEKKEGKKDPTIDITSQRPERLPTLAQMTGIGDNPTEATNNALETLKNWIENYENFVKKIKETYSGQIAINKKIRDENKEKRKEANLKLKNREVNMDEEVHLKKTIVEGFLSGLGAAFGNISSMKKYAEDFDKRLDSSFKNQENILNDKVSKLIEKYYETLNAKKKYSIGMQIRKCYSDFLSVMGDELLNYEKALGQYVDRSGEKANKSIKKFEKVDRKENPKGFIADLDNETINNVAQSFINEMKETPAGKIALLALYQRLNKLSGSVKSSDLEAVLTRPITNELKFPVEIKENENGNKTINKITNSYFDKYYSFDYPKGTYNTIKSVIDTVIKDKEIIAEFKKSLKVLSSVKKLLAKENLDEKIKEFNSGYNLATVKAETNASTDRSIPAEENLTNMFKNENKIPYSHDQIVNYKDFDDYKLLGFISNLNGKIIIYNLEGTDADKNKGFIIGKEKFFNAQKAFEQIKFGEEEDKKNGISPTAAENKTPAVNNTNISEANKQIYSNCLEEFKKLSDYFFSQLNNYKGADKTKLKDINNDFARIRDGEFNELEKVKNNPTEKDFVKFQAMIDSFRKLLYNAKQNNLVESKINKEIIVEMFLFEGVYNNSITKLNSIRKKITDVIETLKKPVQAAQSQQSATNFQSSQPVNSQQQNTSQQPAATVTTAAADSTYGNGYNYKPKKIKEVVYRKGNYTVKTKEEI